MTDRPTDRPTEHKPRQPQRAPRPEGWTSDDWSTPPELVAELAREFGAFDLDPCCREITAKAPRFYTRETNGLAQEWRGRVWLNPPYSDPAPWLEKAIEAQRAGALTVALLPASTDTAWFHDLVLPYAEVRFVRGRVRFYGWEGTPIGSPRTGSIIVIYRPDRRRYVDQVSARLPRQ